MSNDAAYQSESTGSKHPDRIRMLVLETDQVEDSTADRKGSFGQIFHDLFEKAGKQHEPQLEVETIMKFVVESEGGKIPDPEYIKKEDIHAVLITGSKADAHGDDEWILKLVKYIQTVWKENQDVRFSGICFGHQVLCRALGAKVEPSPDEKWELSHTKIDLNEIGEALFKTKKHIHLHQMHVDHVVAPPTEASSNGLIEDDSSVHVWGSSKDFEVQGVYIRERLFTSQGHLGYDEEMVKLNVDARVESGSLQDTKQAEEAKDKAGMDHDGILVAGAILRFFHGEDKDIK